MAQEVQSGSRRALVTMSIGDPAGFAGAHGIFRRYCRRHGLEFVTISERKIRYSPFLFRRRFALHLEKFQIFELLALYDRILYLDSDILLLPHCPDVLAEVSPEALGCVHEDVGPDAWKRHEEMMKAQRRLGPVPNWSGGFFNAGMLVLSRAHRELFRFDRRDLAKGRWPDQTTLNFRVARAGIPKAILPPAYNLLPVFADQWSDPGKRLQAHIVHYAGQENKAMMLADLPRVQAAWESLMISGNTADRES
ncbi:MAG: hypothetical protein JJT96_18505 [Opitutales bacterium]|nr:hypothetical protein [Opitutales bacterium]